MQLSFWEKKTWFSGIDVTIIGSGIVGLCSAINLKILQPGLSVLVVDRGFLPYGASTRNAGFACFGSASELLDDLTRMSEDEVFRIVEKRFKGLQKLRTLLGDEEIEYLPYGGYELFSGNEDSCYDGCISKLDFLNAKVFEVTGIKNAYQQKDNDISQFGFHKIKHLIKNIAEGQIDTGKMMSALLEKAKSFGVTVLNGMDIQRFEEQEKGVLMFTNHDFSFNTKKMLVCNNGFAKQLLPTLDVEPARAQILITHPIENLKIKGTFHYDKGYYYFRNIGNRILFGGGRNLDFTGENTTDFGLTETVQNKLEQMLTEMILPGQKFEIEQRWSGIMGLGNTKTTVIQKISDHVFCAVRMGGMGIAIGSVVGEAAAEMVLAEI